MTNKKIQEEKKTNKRHVWNHQSMDKLEMCQYDRDAPA